MIELPSMIVKELRAEIMAQETLVENKDAEIKSKDVELKSKDAENQRLQELV